ncbi:MAG TPA: GNAT family N-acetyltransferase [Bacillales bacterium]|nr:GNAT family N-acetyltransferase [Bacillales bacterium]
MTEQTWKKGDYTISTDRQLMDRDMIYHYLSQESYWAQGLPRTVFEKSFAHSSLCFGLFTGDPTGEGTAEQIGFARVVSDMATFAYLADVFILTPYRGQGLSKWMIDTILKHPEMQGLRRFMLATRDAHSLYSRFGFRPLSQPDKMMEIARGKEVYAQNENQA